MYVLLLGGHLGKGGPESTQAFFLNQLSCVADQQCALANAQGVSATSTQGGVGVECPGVHR